MGDQSTAVNKPATAATTTTKHQLFVCNLSANTKASDLKSLFIKLVKITRTDIIRFHRKPDHLYGLLTFKDRVQMQKCIKNFNRINLNGNVIRLTERSPLRMQTSKRASVNSIKSEPIAVLSEPSTSQNICPNPPTPNAVTVPKPESTLPNPTKTFDLYVSGINSSTKAQHLKNFISKHTKIHDEFYHVKIIRFRQIPGEFFGFATFKTKCQMEKCIETLDKANFNGSIIELSQSSPLSERKLISTKTQAQSS